MLNMFIFQNSCFRAKSNILSVVQTQLLEIYDVFDIATGKAAVS